jgi:hypothetical protein
VLRFAMGRSRSTGLTISRFAINES